MNKNNIFRFFLLLLAAIPLSFLNINPTQAQRRFPRTCNDGIRIFRDVNFQGEEYLITRPISNLTRIRFNDEISSMCIPEGWVINFHEHADYQGRSFTIRGKGYLRDLRYNAPDGRDWNDRISSISFRREQQSNRSCNNNPTIFQHVDFQGEQYQVTRPIHDLSRIRFNDEISSICVPRGWTMTVYEHANYQGRSLTIKGQGSLRDLRYDTPDGRDWNDRISSISFGRGDEINRICEDAPIIFQHVDFEGREYRLTDSIHDLSRIRFNDEISSICVPKGWSLIVYQHANYQGNSLRISGEQYIRNISQYRNWNDQISSIKVIRSSRRF